MSGLTTIRTRPERLRAFMVVLLLGLCAALTIAPGFIAVNNAFAGLRWIPQPVLALLFALAGSAVLLTAAGPRRTLTLALGLWLSLSVSLGLNALAHGFGVTGPTGIFVYLICAAGCVALLRDGAA